MKYKVLTILAVTLLFCGMFATAIHFAPEAEADIMYHLTVYTNPPGIPINGTGDYTDGTYVELQALDPYTSGNTKYVFDHWDVDGVYWGTANPLQWIFMDKNRNATAHYNTQYKVTFPDTGMPGVTEWIYSSATGWVETNSMFVGSGLNAYVGVKGLWSSPAGVYADPPFNHQWAYLINFTANSNNAGIYVTGFGWESGPIPVNGPVVGGTVWGMMYALYVSSDPNPPVPDVPGTGWYYRDTIVPLKADDYSTNFAVYRYTLDHWTVDGVLRTVNGTGYINVQMNTNHTAIAYYKRQSFVYLDDNIGNFSGFKTNGKWYDDGVVYTFAPTTPLPVATGVRYDFRYWDKPGYPWTNTSYPLNIKFDPTWDGETLRARYQTQYYLVIQSSPTVPNFLYLDSVVTGWYDAWSTVYYKAKPLVQTSSTSQFVFIEWRNQYGGIDPNNNGSGPMSQPWTLTAYYKLQYKATWQHTPTSITVTGSPGSAWFDNGTDIWYGLPATDVSGMFVFKDWVINGVAYPQGQNTVHYGIMTGPIDGTAEYANKTKIYMSPDYHEETAPAFCNLYNVTVYATNFDANRLDGGGQPMDIYAFDLTIAWNPAYLELKSVSLNLASFFAPNSYFIGFNVINNVAGTYHLVATVKGNYTGFSGTKAIFTMTFHVIYDPCYNNPAGTWIYFSNVAISNHLGNGIWPELGFVNSYYYITAPKPMLDIKNHANGTHLVKVDKNVPQQTFDVDVFLLNGIKVHDFYVEVTYDPTKIEADSVVIATYLKAPYVVYAWWINKGAGIVYVSVVQDASVPLQNGSGLLFTIHFKVVNQIFYKTGGPFELQCDITVQYAYLSARCEVGEIIQATNNGLLGSVSCHYVYNPLPGDVNFDGVVDVLDLQLIVDHWGTPDYDVVTDGTTNLWDLVFVALRFGNHI